MISLRKLFRTEPQYLILLESMSEQGCVNAQAVSALIASRGAEAEARVLQDGRARENEIAKEFEGLLCGDNTGPFSRDDMESLVRLVQAVPKRIRHFGG